MKVNQIICGDALTTLKELPDACIDMCCTSPPYHALRSYLPDTHPDKPLELGLEPTYTEYINKLCDVFDEVKRVLKPTGSCWVNLADNFSGSGGKRKSSKMRSKRTAYLGGVGVHIPPTNIPKKSLCLIPFRFAIEMVRRGWILRNTIIWQKVNATPDSMKDRFTIDFEYLFFLSKSPRYYFNQQFEPTVDAKTRQNGQLWRNKRSVWTISTRPSRYPGHYATYPEELVETPIRAGSQPGGIVLDCFSGTSTTCAVAKRLGRQYIGIELNETYVELGNKRLADVVPDPMPV
ncbi:MAG TPA: site-specific DNA-methyltransferase [Ktedonobacteraceae bacterium]|nr:site-specific DNA-methyltransferase [Ktedonobacteraceae bacterium]